MSKKVRLDVIDDRVRGILNRMQRAIQTGIPENSPEGTLDNPETATILREIALRAFFP